ncbi:MAG: tetratricopeptide repeat protein [Rubrivivax sp.]|jgi:lipopolysaccharide biosynthesis regulator YciM
MDFDLSWLLLAMPAAFGLGWMASRLDLRQSRQEYRDAPRAYFKGLSLLLNEQHDKAIDAFIEAIQDDPDTVDLHFALGSLFRRRGEFQRAIRVHEHVLSRPELPLLERQRARHALAQDFLRAGLFDRAEDCFRQLEGTPFEVQARLARLSLQERARDWERAIEVAQLLHTANAGSFAERMAHYRCEIATELWARAQPQAALGQLELAREAAPDLARSWVLGGQWALQQGQAHQALQQWQTLIERQPVAFDLVATDFATAAQAAGRTEWARNLLQARFGQSPSLALLKALLVLEAPDPGQGQTGGPAADPSIALSQTGAARLVEALRSAPSLSATALLLRQPATQWGPHGLEAARLAVERAARPVQRYRCAACGFEAQHYFWQCPGCLGWDTFPPRTIEEL